MELCSSVNGSSDSTGSICSPERTPETVLKRTRDRKSSSENSDSSQSRKRNKYANLPEDIAETKRRKANQQERERQRLLTEVFQELRDLNMPSYNIPGHKSDSRYYLLKSAICHIRELRQRQANEEIKSSIQIQGEVVLKPPTQQEGLDLILPNKKASFFKSEKSVQAFGREFVQPSQFLAGDGCLGNMSSTESSANAVIPEGEGFISKGLRVPKGQVNVMTNGPKSPNGQVHASNNGLASPNSQASMQLWAKDKSDKMTNSQVGAIGVACAGFNGRAPPISQVSIAKDGYTIAAAGSQSGVAMNGHVVAGNHISVKSKGGRKRSNSVIKDDSRVQKSVKCDQCMTPMDVPHKNLSSKEAMLKHQFNRPVLLQSNLQRTKQSHKSESKENISMAGEKQDLIFPQLQSPAAHQQVHIGVMGSLFDIHGVQNTSLNMVLPTLFSLCQNPPCNTSNAALGNTSSDAPGNTVINAPGKSSLNEPSKTGFNAPGKTGPNTPGNKDLGAPDNTGIYAAGKSGINAAAFKTVSDNTSINTSGKTGFYGSVKNSFVAPGTGFNAQGTGLYASGNTRTNPPGKTGLYACDKTSINTSGKNGFYASGNISIDAPGNTDTGLNVPSNTDLYVSGNTGLNAQGTDLSGSDNIGLNAPGYTGSKTCSHPIPNTTERSQPRENIQQNVSLPNVHFGRIPPSTQPLCAQSQRVQYNPMASTSTTPYVNEKEPTHFLGEQEDESESFNIFKNFVSFVST